ncbi:unnamed protein product [Clavelina lepadiformis]|uniref:Band 7 domain-containing protein n=1 Tax=Clavelina lepadiformis TaxID=159417 RepID=A0ABP0GXN7_CLALP
MEKTRHFPLQAHHGMDFDSLFTYEPSRTEVSYKPFSSQTELLSTEKQTWLNFICTSIVTAMTFLIFLMTFPFSTMFTLKLARHYERIIVYRLGRPCPIKGPGLVFVLPCIDKWLKVDLRTKAFHVPPSKLQTVDGCIISVGAIIHFRIYDAMLMYSTVQDINHVVRDGAHVEMNNLLSKTSYYDLKSKRQRLSYNLQTGINITCKQWGVEISRAELSEVTLLMAPQAQQSSAMYGTASPPNLHTANSGNSMLDSITQIIQQFNQFTTTKNISNDTQLNKYSTKDIFSKMQAAIENNLVKSVGLTYEFSVTGQVEKRYYLDLKSEQGIVGEGRLPSGNPDVIVTLSCETLQELIEGSLSYYSAYASGKLLLQGAISDVMKLEPILKLI